MAGMGTRDIKRKIKSVNSTKQITKAMELVSTAKLRRNKNRMDMTKPYFEVVMNAVQDIIRNETSFKHEYINNREVKNSLYIIVTADRGLCGGYNANAMKLLANEISNKDSALLITIGKKATDFFEKRDYKVFKNYTYISESPTFSHAQDIARNALKLYSEEKIDEIKFIYTSFKSTISQEPVMLKLLPVEVDKSTEVDVKEENLEDYEFITYEPSAEFVLEFIIPKYIESTIYGGMVESSASEQAARRVAMESATDNADDMISELTLTYNQARQSSITQEISEIVGGAEALK
ncbi:ATP synthase F1 subunit gamma [Helicovermis profundi]|uniref:ATP synthase gamma chain n=1 Tax=Helicovermis profundi TaxID=3065157 RepID=A0AAU9E671_9FIRM|nr:ATP synthase F1 subunit gamma [Clostridia bacterium S502]